MIKRAGWFCWVVILVLVFCFAFTTGCGDDDDDDNDTGVVTDDDNTTDDDATDDDVTDDDDDTTDDDATDDDVTDDDDDDVVDPYDGMMGAGKTVGQMLGISSHISKSTSPSTNRDFEIQKLGEAGVQLLRTDFKWDYFENQDDVWNFAGYDVMVDACLAGGIQLDALMDYGVDWAMPGGSHDEIDPADWADFTGTVAGHYADKIDIYEIWNEQNTTRFWKPAPNPETYGDLLRAGYNAIHAADATADVLFGGMSTFDAGLFGDDGMWNFILRVHDYHNDLCDIMDGMAIHPYTFLQQSSPEWVFELGPLVYGSTPDAIDIAREHLTEIGCGDMPIHLTEYGWPSLIIGDRRQGAYLARGFVWAAAKQVESVYWYTFWDGDGVASIPTEDYFGLFTWPGGTITEKPSYIALNGLNEILGQAQFAGDLGTALGWDEDLHAMVFIKNGIDVILALWHSNPDIDKQVEVQAPLHPLAFDNWAMFAQDGTSFDSGAVNEGPVTVKLTGEMTYLQCSIGDR